MDLKISQSGWRGSAKSSASFDAKPSHITLSNALYCIYLIKGAIGLHLVSGVSMVVKKRKKKNEAGDKILL